MHLTEQLDKEIEKLSGKEVTDDDCVREDICTLAESLEQSLSQVRFAFFDFRMLV